jgi:hypothetical protein
MDILIRIKRLVIARRVAFTRKADDEMAIDGLTRELVYEAILNAPIINKKLKSHDPASGQKENLYVIKGFTYDGLGSIRKGKLRKKVAKRCFMSLSHQNGRRIKPVTTSNSKGNWWNELPAVMSCPECGKKAMRRARGPCQLLDGTLIPDLERFHCFSCEADFFDDVAMGVIEKFRQSPSPKPPRARRRRRAKSAVADR